MAEPKWWQRMVELGFTTCCMVGVLAVLAHKPDLDEVYKGAATACMAWFISQITTKIYTKDTADKK